MTGADAESETPPRGRIVPADEAGIRAAAEVLSTGGLVALPTETVYGLGARADEEDALRKIFEAKQRPADNPLIAHVRDAAHARELAAPGTWDARVDELTERFWPGPLTVVLPRNRQTTNEVLTAGGETVALRMPAANAFRQVLAAVEPAFAIAAPSANPSERTSPTTAEHVADALGDRVDLILDGGPCRLGLESTVVAVTPARPARLLRHGSTPLDALRAALPDLEIAPAGRPADTDAVSASPGQRARHYAPRAKVVLTGAPSLPHVVASALERHGSDAVGVLTRGPIHEELPGPIRIFAMPLMPEDYAARLYATFHEADRMGLRVLCVVAPPDEDAWQAIRDRLLRAAR